MGTKLQNKTSEKAAVATHTKKSADLLIATSTESHLRDYEARAGSWVRGPSASRDTTHFRIQAV